LLYNSKRTKEAIYNIAWKSRIGNIDRIYIYNRPGIAYIDYFRDKAYTESIEGYSEEQEDKSLSIRE
jgi:hypothetical protein